MTDPDQVDGNLKDPLTLVGESSRLSATVKMVNIWSNNVGHLRDVFCHHGSDDDVA